MFIVNSNPSVRNDAKIPCSLSTRFSNFHVRQKLGSSSTARMLGWMQSRYRYAPHKATQACCWQILMPSSENVTGSHLIPGADFCWTQNSGLIVLSSRTWKLYHFWLHHTDKFSRLRITSLAGEGWSLSLMSSTLVFGSWLWCDLTLDYLFRTFSTSWTCMLHILPNSVQLLFLLVVSTCAYSYFLHNFNNITLISYPTGPWGFTYTFHSVFALLPPS